MLIIDPKELSRYASFNRLWQGIPGIEITAGGRLFATFYSGNDREDVGNYAMVVKSDDDGKTWSEPIAVAYYGEDARAYDPCLWIDPQGRLWFFVAVSPAHREVAFVCDDPDADTLVWSEEIYVGEDVMMNKPIVTADGRWLLPIAIWRDGVSVLVATDHSPKLSNVYESRDQGKSFTRIGGADVANRSYDEHMVLERRDGSLLMLVRTAYGIGKCESFDGGKTWSEGSDSGLGGPDSRFCLRRLQSGRVLLINHNNSNKPRSGLTAYLSEDEGKSFPYSLLLDERLDVSYPDVTQRADGLIYVAYDRERGAMYKTRRLEPADSAKEILFCTFREEDILAGRFSSADAKERQIISKLGFVK